MAEKVTVYYGLDPQKPYKISVLWDITKQLNADSDAYHFESTSIIGITNTYELASALIQMYRQSCWALGVLVFGVTTQEIVSTTFGGLSFGPVEPQEYFLGAAAATGGLEGGPSNRVIGMKCKGTATSKASILAAGVLGSTTAGFSNNGSFGQSTQLGLLDKFRLIANTKIRYTVSTANSVQAQLEQLSNYPDQLYHGVRRA